MLVVYACERLERKSGMREGGTEKELGMEGANYTVNKPLRSIVLSNKRIGFTSIKCFRSRSPI